MAKKGEINAQKLVADMYLNGDGINKNYSKSLYWYKKLAKKGDAYAKAQITEVNKMIEQQKVELKRKKAIAKAERERKRAEEKAEEKAEENAEVERCYKVTGITVGLAQSISQRLRVRVSSVQFLRRTGYSFSGMGCGIMVDTSKGAKQCAARSIVESNGSYLATGYCINMI